MSAGDLGIERQVAAGARVVMRETAEDPRTYLSAPWGARWYAWQAGVHETLTKNRNELDGRRRRYAFQAAAHLRMFVGNPRTLHKMRSMTLQVRKPRRVILQLGLLVIA